MRRLKIGRNQKCPCESGKKYKKCCIPKDLLTIVREKTLRPDEIDRQGFLVGRPKISESFKGKRVRAVGSKLYYDRPEDESFHDFLIVHLKDVFGKEWGLTEINKPLEDRHLVVKWIDDLVALYKKFNHSGKNVAIHPSGNVKSLICLAYDVYSAEHCGQIPNDLLNRLRNREHFQGARYELAIAAIFYRAGYSIEWLSKQEKKHCEFIATHKRSKERIAVEAKSRKRPNVLGYKENSKETYKDVSVGIGRLFNRALKQKSSADPFYIFIDANLPISPGVSYPTKEWMEDFQIFLSENSDTKLQNDHSALFLTNFSWHYQRESSSLLDSESVMILPSRQMENPKHAFTQNLIYSSVKQYGIVPHHDKD